MCEQETGKAMKKMAADFRNPNYGAIDKGKETIAKGKVARTQVKLSAEEEEAFQVCSACHREGTQRVALRPIPLQLCIWL